MSIIIKKRSEEQTTKGKKTRIYRNRRGEAVVVAAAKYLLKRDFYRMFTYRLYFLYRIIIYAKKKGNLLFLHTAGFSLHVHKHK